MGPPPLPLPPSGLKVPPTKPTILPLLLSPQKIKKNKKNHNLQFILSILYFILYFILSNQFISLPLLYIPPIIKKKFTIYFIYFIFYSLFYFIKSIYLPPLLYI